LVRWPQPWLVRLGIVGNLALIALWAWTRTIGIPFVGPGAGEVEPVSALDVVAKVVEGGLIALLIVLLWQLGRRWRRRSIPSRG
jgi:hypothetical protein